MRLRKMHAGVMVQSILPWEEEHLASLAAQGSAWVPLSSIGAQGQVLGEINSRTYAIRLRPGVEIVDRQVVVLSPPEVPRR
ncbi:hypothetical protein KSC_093290 [Ktedonobacter sp. SOSP1-52]|uniref:transcriptional regulator n=1 Tax=Ktedonobacter sp. SOSP1-52 TaxID=2778366 RepID=UPI0019164524|nr:transcriptional regulator [Ktedonobacter sp. SOSP1-52]GHO70437.1 hypothetical protein KSC_093290 [Ktedonobacter sp. SOSP1-52]